MSEDSNIIKCTYATEAPLYFAYMPFLKGGGLFVRSAFKFNLGDKVKLEVQIPGESEVFHIEAKATWFTPRAAQGNKPVGLGFQFLGESAKVLNSKIETLLAGMLKSAQPNDTM